MRKRVVWCAIGIASLLALMSAPAVALAGERAFIGVKKCKMCHNSSKKGAQYTKWTETKHSKAYETLASDKAKEAAAAKGIADPQKADECLKCHVTGHGLPEELLTDKYDATEGVGCESCHGPGAEYFKMSTMKDREAAVAAGLVIPTAETCTGCHNEESPFFEGFNFEEFYAKIAHPRPAE